MNGSERGERLQVMLSAEELRAVDEFRYRHKIPSRAAAVRELLQIGLSGSVTDGDGRKSSEYGLFGRGANSHSAGE
ncbi:hypothetical protein ASD45_08130 [Pseudolabrys sp. Root1462]|nr:hypothetical protein [Pseudolabrys sp. Root1462]KQZ00826.1 hypothetical protein ASD45_08130 [Pseudolabrys sp. Root1462]